MIDSISKLMVVTRLQAAYGHGRPAWRELS